MPTRYSQAFKDGAADEIEARTIGPHVDRMLLDFNRQNDELKAAHGAAP